jgi:hypothetical protein
MGDTSGHFLSTVPFRQLTARPENRLFCATSIVYSTTFSSSPLSVPAGQL